MSTTSLGTHTPTLLHFRLSHYNEKARWALDYKRIPHHRKALVPGFHIPRVRSLSGQNKVPVLTLGEQVIAGSDVILSELERLMPTPALFPADPSQRKRALGLQKFFDEEVAPTLRRFFWFNYLQHPAECARMATSGFDTSTRVLWRTAFPILKPLFSRNMNLDAERAAQARAKIPTYFDRLESEIGPSGYLVGDNFSVADLAVASIMSGLVRPPEVPYTLPEPGLPTMVELREELHERAGFKWVLEMYKRHRGSSAQINPSPNS